MSKNITWLHISDLHAGKKGMGWDASRVKDTLVNDLRKMEHEHDLHPDFIFFTGDAAFGEAVTSPTPKMPNQFTIAQQFFSSVRQAFDQSIPITNVFIVPGNHDVNRKVVGDDQTSWLDNQHDPWEIYKLLEACEPQWKRYMERLAAYREFLTNNSYSHLLTDIDRLVYAITRQVSDVTIGICGFNSAWSCCREQEKAKLWVGGKWQLENVRAKLNHTMFSIALLHHPTNWFNTHEDPEFGREIERDFHFVLHGHEHENWVKTYVDGHTTIAAGACYERSDKYKESGYNFVRLDLESGTGEVWLREYKSGGWVQCIVPGKKTDDHGMWPLNKLPWLTPITPPPSQPQSPTKILLLSDRSDLAVACDYGFGSQSLPPIMRQAPVVIEQPREDITWQVVESKLNYQVPLEEKTPLLQELRTEQQIAYHFLPLPKFTKRLNSWLTADRDYLFLGLPFCGKTTLLTYIALETSKRQRDTLIPIYLKPREDLTIEETEAAVVRLTDTVKQKKLSLQKQRIVFILDNVHIPANLKIARLLMESPRSWRLLAAARPRELAECLPKGSENPWNEEDCIRDVCRPNWENRNRFYRRQDNCSYPGAPWRKKAR